MHRKKVRKNRRPSRRQPENLGDVYTPPLLQNRTYQRIQIESDGSASWMSPITLEHPPLGELTDVTVQTSGGSEITNGHFYAYDHIDGGVMFVAPTSQPMLNNSAFTTVLRGKAISFNN